MIQWHYGEHGQQFGPVTDAEMRSMIVSGRIAPQTVVWREGMAGWRPLAEVAELSPGAYVGGVPLMPQIVVPNANLATACLVFGIFGFLLSCVWIGALAGIPAVICGHMAISQIRRDPQRVGGNGMAVGGLVLGYLAIVIQVIVVCFFVFAIWKSRIHSGL